MGPFTAHVAMRAAPDAQVKGLIVLSHGTGGTEVGHTSLAEALARDGYLVAALRHPGDNWQDSSLLSKSAARYFTERPQQASRVIDALLKEIDVRISGEGRINVYNLQNANAEDIAATLQSLAQGSANRPRAGGTGPGGLPGAPHQWLVGRPELRGSARALEPGARSLRRFPRRPG